MRKCPLAFMWHNTSVNASSEASKFYFGSRIKVFTIVSYIPALNLAVKLISTIKS